MVLMVIIMPQYKQTTITIFDCWQWSLYNIHERHIVTTLVNPITSMVVHYSSDE